MEAMEACHESLFLHSHIAIPQRRVPSYYDLSLRWREAANPPPRFKSPRWSSPSLRRAAAPLLDGEL